MAFQAGGAHALDRALEAIAYAYAEMTRHPATADWEKPAGKGDPLRMSKTFHVVPRGVALVIGCNTFPTWNSYPGLFASLATGNAVIVKPHPGAVLPLAITVKLAREVLADAGFDPNLVLLAPEAPGEKIASTLATRPEVKIIDFTGSTAYGDWLEQQRPPGVRLHREGRRQHHRDRLDRRLRRHVPQHRLLAHALQRPDVHDAAEHPGAARRHRDRVGAPELRRRRGRHRRRGRQADRRRRAGRRADRRDRERGRRVAHRRGPSHGTVLLDSREVAHPSYPGAVVRTPLLLTQDAANEGMFDSEWFGPITFIVATDSTAQSLDIFRRIVGRKGALTAAVYSTDPGVLDAMEAAAIDVGVHLSCNLTGGVFVNQSAAFSDFHASGANAAANASLTDGAYVSNRFRVVQSRRHN